ncbi:5-(carboxyamino)imidazole ribonucleotide synthase [Sphingomonas sp. LaA6.9]|uniref:5-(carboxyamino)imidazole ribonucleotide synthase n=1 Tax=Sphingomonas sp. LaA6.9 TaxID=2919914 RepID=UPI001F4FFA03|nr:5-(carboxyamino)imidazole ribonucleotide synthase [Sphingomonas sp. LaA6.9]MCJ8158519.1 5-(carboxyamino)imidazole ribonucleotide synthase [Sphingomonas sp. LaA6.9]
MNALKPGSTIGIIGGGQLGRMLASAAAQLGYRCHVYAPDGDSVAAEVSAFFTQAAYDDEEALSRFADSVDVVTYEFENLPVAPLRALAAKVPVRPSPEALAVAQDRLSEKAFVTELGGRTAPWAPVSDRDALGAAITRVGTPAILKTTRFGYDGKGQARLHSPADADDAWKALGGRPAILEGFVRFEREFSVIVARGIDGREVSWDPADNLHDHGILSHCVVPAGGIVERQAQEARLLAMRVAEKLDYVGVLTLEFFASAEGPVFNEMAPRVHNSGHWTIEGAVTSQFENHIRAVCGLPLGDTRLAARRVTMDNLIGEAADNWDVILADPSAHLHLYGKDEARPGRKMGHVTRLEF